MDAVDIDSMKEVVIGITEKLGNGWQVTSTVIKSLDTTQKRVEARTITLNTFPTMLVHSTGS